MITITSKDLPNSPLSIEKSRVLIGSDPQNDVVINDFSVDKYHAQILTRNGVKILSPNGASVTIDGRMILSEFVNLPCEVKLGNVCLHLSFGSTNFQSYATNQNDTSQQKKSPPKLPISPPPIVQTSAVDIPKPVKRRSKKRVKILLGAAVLFVFWIGLEAILNTGSNPSMKEANSTEPKETVVVDTGGGGGIPEKINEKAAGQGKRNAQTALKDGDQNQRSPNSPLKQPRIILKDELDSVYSFIYTPQDSSIMMEADWLIRLGLYKCKFPLDILDLNKSQIREVKIGPFSGTFKVSIPTKGKQVIQYQHWGSRPLDFKKENLPKSPDSTSHERDIEFHALSLDKAKKSIEILKQLATIAPAQVGVVPTSEVDVRGSISKAQRLCVLGEPLPDNFLQTIDKDVLRGQAEKGDSCAQFLWAYVNDRKYGLLVFESEENVVRWYLKSAKQGYSKAYNVLGEIYLNGRHGVSEDYQASVEWFKKAALQGDAMAMNQLGLSYTNGRGVKQDHKEAVRWYMRSASQGHAIAQYNLGFVYTHGQGVKQDHEEALQWYRLSAKQGYKGGQRGLGVAYLAGLGVEKDLKMAKMWFELSAAQGDKHSKRILVNIKKSIQGENVGASPPANINQTIKDFTAKFYAAGNSSSKTSQELFYADVVNYFGESLTKAQIQQDQREYAAKWKDRVFEPDVTKIKVRVNDNKTEAVVEIPFTIQLTTFPIQMTGKRLGTLKLNLESASPKIVGISSTLIGEDKTVVTANAPKGTQVKKVNGKWLLVPPSIVYQENEIRRGEIAEDPAGSWGRMYYVLNLLDGNDGKRYAATSFKPTRADLERMKKIANDLNAKNNTTTYYVRVGTEF